MNTVHMSKSTLYDRPAIQTLKSSLKRLSSRVLSFMRVEKYDANPGPQWQQLELPFSRTPVKRWNR